MHYAHYFYMATFIVALLSLSLSYTQTQKEKKKGHIPSKLYAIAISVTKCVYTFVLLVFSSIEHTKSSTCVHVTLASEL